MAEEMNQEQDKQVFDKAYAEEIIKKRAKQAQEAADRRVAEKEEEIRRRDEKIEELSRQMEQMKATSSTQNEMQSAGKQLTSEELEMMATQRADEMIKEQEFQKQLNEAVEKDDEFKKLTKEGNALHPAIIKAVSYLDNAPAVIKHLLKDKKDWMLMMAKAQEGQSAFIDFANNLSNKIEATISKPRPSEFEPNPNFNDAGESNDSYNNNWVSNYVKNFP